MTQSLEQRRIIVTGAASGIGWATARLLQAHGASLVLWDRDENSVMANASSLAKSGGQCMGLGVDVTHAEKVAAATAQSIDFLGGLDGAFNNAGIGAPTVPLADLGEADFDSILAVNLKGVFLCMKHQLLHMRDNGGGSIVNNASVAGLVALEGQSGYTASKHAVVGLSKTAAVENAADGVRVNAICPGAVRTPILSHLDAAGITAEVLASMSPQNRVAEPKEIAEAVAWLLSAAAGFVTGAALPIDGGWSAR